MDELINAIRERFGHAVLDSYTRLGETTLIVKPEALHDLMLYLRDSGGFEMLTDLTAVDWLGRREPRFEVVYHLHSYSRNLRLRVKCPCEGSVNSVVDIWLGAGFMERETWEMFGIEFKGNPELTHILLWDGFPGWPLRKDFNWREDVPLPDNR
ncbi:MAG: NADH-quinone oxidoreductase subunit C [candidate division WOR-3 bacterium]